MAEFLDTPFGFVLLTFGQTLALLVPLLMGVAYLTLAERKILAALERIVPLAGKRIADVGTGIGHYPLLLARRTGRTYGIETDPALVDEARRRAAELHQPNLRIVEIGDSMLQRDGALVRAAHGVYRRRLRETPELIEQMRTGGRAREVTAALGGA